MNTKAGSLMATANNEYGYGSAKEIKLISEYVQVKGIHTFDGEQETSA
jgi:hypothetical protein